MRLPKQTVEIVKLLRDCVRAEDGACQELLNSLVQLPEFADATVTGGFFVTSDGRIEDGHMWLMMPDGSCFDPSQDQFDDGFGDITHASVRDPKHRHYFPYTGERGIPMNVLNFADRIRSKRRNSINKRSFGEMIESFQEIEPEPVSQPDWEDLNSLIEASSATPSSDVARQSATDLPDYMTPDGREGIPQDDFDDEFTPEEFQDELRKITMDDISDEDPGDLSFNDLKEADEYDEYKEQYSCGKCIWLALALNERFGWDIKVQIERDSEHGDYIAHAYNVLPNGKEIDIMGISDKVDTYSNEIISLTANEVLEMIGSPTNAEEEIRRANEVIDKYLDLSNVHIKEVDHPEYMPGGEEEARYDPELELGRPGERYSGYNTGHPQP